MTHKAALTRRQHQILDYLKSYTEETGMAPTLEEIAANFGVNKVTIFGHIGELERKGVIERAGKGLSRSLRVVEEEAPRSAISVSILGSIAAGSPIQAIEEPEVFDLGDLIPQDRDVYALRVKGNSMIEDSIRDGDIVLVERRESARNGETVVAVLEDEEVTLKRFYKEAGRIRLQPANSSMGPIYADDVQVRGVVIGVLRQF
jgi:repressor LexA